MWIGDAGSDIDSALELKKETYNVTAVRLEMVQ